MSQQKPLEVGAASLASLRAELARKTTEFKRQKMGQQPVSRKLQARKGTDKWLKANKGVALRALRDAEQAESEDKSLASVEARLKAKAALYERLRREDLPPEEQEKYLVDFERKYMERVLGHLEEQEEHETAPHSKRPKKEASEPSESSSDDQERSDDDEDVDYVDEFGRTRKCTKREKRRMDREQRRQARKQAARDRRRQDLVSHDMEREMRRQEWEQKAQEEMAKPRGPIHYSTVREGEIRQMGTGYFQFSQDEEERQAQMKALDELRAETQEGRSRRERLKKRRQAALQQRLAKIKQRKEQSAATRTATLQKDDGSPSHNAPQPAEDVEGETIDDFLSSVRYET